MASLERFPRRAGIARLAARTTLSPHMIRVTLACDAFGGEWPIQQPGEIVTLLFCAPDEPIVTPVAGWRFPEGAPAQEWRNYTVRRHDAGRGEIDVDVVLHEPPGPACRWACDAPIGSGVGYAGPRVDFAPVHDAEWLLLCGDETALPAIAAILEARPPQREVVAVVEVPDGRTRPAIDVPPNGRVHWVSRDGAPAATTTHLVDALRALPLPDGVGQAWGAAESGVARDVRAVLRDERGLPRTHARARGYWLRSGDWLEEEA